MSADRQTSTAHTLGMIRYVHGLYIVGAFILGWLLFKIIFSLWVTLNLQIAIVPPPNDFLSVLVGGIAAVGIAYYLWKHPQVNRLAVEIVAELSKVTWPTRKELSASTVVVIVLSVIASVIMGLFDFFWAWATDWILGLR